jgi:hypothetical protein
MHGIGRHEPSPVRLEHQMLKKIALAALLACAATPAIAADGFMCDITVGTSKAVGGMETVIKVNDKVIVVFDASEVMVVRETGRVDMQRVVNGTALSGITANKAILVNVDQGRIKLMYRFSNKVDTYSGFCKGPAPIKL